MEKTTVTINRALGMTLQMNYLLYGWFAEIENGTIDKSIKDNLLSQIKTCQGFLNAEIDKLGEKDEPEEEDTTESTSEVEEVG
jgi:hypothetical protein